MAQQIPHWMISNCCWADSDCRHEGNPLVILKQYSPGRMRRGSASNHLVNIWNDYLTCTSSFGNNLFSYQVSCPQTAHDPISVQIKIKRPPPELRCLAIKVSPWAVDVCGFLFVDNQANTFLHKKIYTRAASTLVRMFSTFPFSCSI